jgi:peroxiredoxin Q/BCP
VIFHLSRRALCVAALAGALALAAGRPARAADIEVGQVAPDFTLPDQDGKVHQLSDYKGKYVVLAFYPKDMTPG